MEFKEKVLFVRAKLNLSQMDMAKELGVSFQTIYTKQSFWFNKDFVEKIVRSED